MLVLKDNLMSTVVKMCYMFRACVNVNGMTIIAQRMKRRNCEYAAI